MTTLLLPRIPATDTNFSSGTASGTPTKVDPGNTLAAQGFVPGTPLPGQHLNFLLHAALTALHQAQLDNLRNRALALHEVRLDGTAITDTAESIGAVQRQSSVPIVAVKTGQSLGLGEAADRFVVLGTPASITSLVTDAATNGTRIIAVGTGGNRSTFTDDDGVNWSAGGDLAAAGRRIVYNSTYDSWIATTTAPAIRYSVDDGVTWTSAGAAVSQDVGLATVSNGDTFTLNSVNAIRKSSDGGATWSTVVGAVPNSGSLDDSGCVIGNGGSVFYHCGRFSSGARLQIASSADGATWTLLATLLPQTAATFFSRPRIMMCRNTGLMVVAATTTADHMALYASLDGINWTGPKLLYPDPGIAALAVAGGRLFYTHDNMLFASPGVGY